jgi:oligosaccharide repeat unit polymerase
MSYSLVLGCLAVAGLAVWVSAKFFRHPLSPFSVFYGIWFTALALYNMNWIAYTPVRRSGWILIGLNLATFGIGWMIPYLAWNRRDFQNSEMVQHHVSAERLRVVIGICLVLGSIGITAFLYSVHSTLGLATYFEEPGLIRQAMASGGEISEPLKPLNWLNVINIVLCSFYLFVLRGRRSRLIWLILAWSLLTTAFMEDRTRFFYAAIWTGFVMAHSMKISGKKLIIGLALGGAILLAQFLTVAIWLGKVAENNPALMEVANVKDAMVLLLPPYMYTTENFPSLQAYIDSRPASTHGAMTFYPAFKLLNLIDPTLEPPAIVAEFVQIPSDSNTFTWLHQFYTDFGLGGVLIGPWAIGMISSAVYFQLLRKRTFYVTYVNGLFCFCLMVSIFTNHFTQGPAWYFLAVGLFIAIWVKKPVAKGALS